MQVFVYEFGQNGQFTFYWTTTKTTRVSYFETLGKHIQLVENFIISILC